MNTVRVATDPDFRWRALAWAVDEQKRQNGFVAFFNNNAIRYPNDPFPNQLFVGQKRVVSLAGPDAIQNLYDAHCQRPSFLVGYLGYDLKNQLENLHSRHPNRPGFPDACFVEPEWIIDFAEDSIVVRGAGNGRELIDAIWAFTGSAEAVGAVEIPILKSRVSPVEYRATVKRIQEHIRAGDVYELNYCLEFFADTIQFNPLAVYRALNARSPMPFSSFLQLGEHYIMGASPERFLKKDGRRLLSQPIKGTAPRGQTPDEDAHLRHQLLHSEKERAENLMIVDLVRNDLARSAETGSVHVDELFGIYGFRQVYQMISTVSATLRHGLTWADAIRHAFPMGSMTGAPKIRAMELIDELEVSRRGVYSGAVGVITPNGDFDFSVVIRTMLYNAQRQYASFSVGSAITYDADPAQEWAECLLKARAVLAIGATDSESRS